MSQFAGLKATALPAEGIRVRETYPPRTFNCLTMELSMAQEFEIEKLSRAIDNTDDVEMLKALAKQLLQAWQVQQAATNWMIRQQAAPSSSWITPIRG